MATAKMKKFRIIVSREDVAGLLCEFMLLGCVEISEPKELLDDTELAELVALESSELESCMPDYETIERGLEIIEAYIPDEYDPSAPKKQITLDKLLFETYPESSLMLSKSLETIDSMLLILPDGEHTDLISQIKAAADQREEFKLCCDHYSVRILLAKTIEKMLGTEYTLLFTGWIPAKSEHEIEQVLSNFVCAWEFYNPASDDDESIPVMQKSPGFIRKFQKGISKQFDPLEIKTKFVEIIRGV